ncbi:hypothetical protein NN561_005745 [Cricetulus griseus]
MPFLTRSQHFGSNYQRKDIPVPRLTEGRNEGSARFSQTAAAERQSWDVHPRLFPRLQALPHSAGLHVCKVEPRGHGTRRGRRARVPALPPPTADAHPRPSGRPPGHPPALTLGVRASRRFPTALARAPSCTRSHVPSRPGCTPRGLLDRGVPHRAAR